MAFTKLELDPQYVLNWTTKHLARERTQARHNYGQFDSGDPRGHICESWRFPVVDSHYDRDENRASQEHNIVTFVYAHPEEVKPSEIAVVGTFANLYEPLPLEPVDFNGQLTGHHALSLVVPQGEVHTYKYLVDGELVLDPINPQRTTLDNGEQWSRFFTARCTKPVSFERWEYEILDRLTDHILPFQTKEGERFLSQYYNNLDRENKSTQYPMAYRFDKSVGVVNFIDKLVAREEHHHLNDYKICLHLIDQVLRQRNPFVEPEHMSKEMYITVYDQMAEGDVPGWDYERYDNPRYFLQLLRRHTFTGAFSHPKHHGNMGAAGWAYLEERYVDGDRQTLFNWRQALEPPLGTNADYLG